MSTSFSDSSPYTIEDSGSSLRLTFSYRKYWVIMLPYTLIGILFFSELIPAGVAAYNNLTTPQPSTTDPLLVFFFLLIFVLAILAGYIFQLLKWLIGQEVVEISNDAIKVEHRVLGWSNAIKLDAQNITGVFVARHDKGPEWFRFRNWSRYPRFKRGKIAINSGKNFWGGVCTLRFGIVLNQTEAREIVKTIHTRFPQYRYQAKNTG